MRPLSVLPLVVTIKLNKEPIIEYLNSNIVLLKWMIAEGYGDRRHPGTSYSGHGKMAGES